MKKYNTPSLNVEVLRIADIIATSGVSHFVKEGTATNDNNSSNVVAAPKSETWNDAWQIN